MRRLFTYIATALLVGAAIAACSVKEESGSATLGKREIKFTASVNQFQTKADAAEEAVGLYVLNTQNEYLNERLAVEGNTLVPERPLYWDPEMNIEDIAQFVAYYPYDANRPSIWSPFGVQPDQSTPEAYTASDLLVAVTQSAPVEGTVHLSFVHKFTRIILSIDNRLADVAIKEVYLYDVYTESDWSIYSDLPGNCNRSSVKMMPVRVDGAAAWAAIIPHQDAYLSVVVVSSDGEAYTIRTDDGIYFGAGKSYQGTAVLDQSASSLEFNQEISDWNEGWTHTFVNQGEEPDPGPGPVPDDSWGLVGDMTGWAAGKDIMMKATEYMGAVAYTVTQDIYTGTQFKFRKNNSWDVNLGYNAEFGDKAYYLTAGSNDLAPGGPNMMVPTSGTWMFVLIPEGNFLAAELLKEFDDPVDPDPDPDPEEPTGDVWSIIGSMNGDGWGIDHDLTTYKAEDGSLWYYIEIKLAEDDEFKFRKDHDWKVNFGPDYPSGTSFTFEDHVLIWSDESTYDVPEIPLRQDGANFRVPVSGLWSLELYPDDAVVLAYRVQE